MTQAPHYHCEYPNYGKAHNTQNPMRDQSGRFCLQSNIISQTVTGVGQADTQLEVPPEVQDLHIGDRGNPHPKSNVMQPPHACLKRKKSIGQNKHEACIGELVVEADLSSTFSKPRNSIPTSHQEVVADSFTTAEQFYTLSNVYLHFGSGSSGSSLACIPPHRQGENPADYLRDINYRESSEDYDAFEDDVLWKGISRKDLYIPWISNPPSQALQGKEDRLIPAQEPKIESRWDYVKDSHMFAGGMGRSGDIASPPTLIPNFQRPVNPPGRRVLAGSWKLARIPDCLAVLDSLGDGNHTPLIPPTTNATDTKWLHLPVTERHKPFARLPPPREVQQRSPIEGLSAKAIIRVCFRVGEAVRFANTASRSCGGYTDLIIELFGLYPETLLTTLD